VVRDSFRIAHAEITRSFNPVAAAGSFLAGGPGSVIIDAGTGAIFGVDPDAVYVSLVSDTAGVDAATVAHLVRRAQLAARDGFAEDGSFRRRAPPWLTAQVATGAYLGGTPEDESDTQTGGLGGTLLVGVRGQRYSARLSATASTGFLFDNSERWEVAALIGVVTEAADGRVRLGLSAGPGLAGGRESNSCFLFCGGYEREQIVLPTRIGLSVLGEAYVFVAPQIGLGLQVPANLRFGDSLGGVLVGWKFEGL